MSLKRAWRAATVAGVMCSAGLAASAASAASATVAWGTTTSAPAGTLGGLFGVAASSSSDVLAVGGYNPGESPTALLTRPYAEHWNGNQWTATTVPLASVYSVQAAQLNGVAEVAAGDGWAVGTVSDPSSFASQTLAYHWNGTAWQRLGAGAGSQYRSTRCGHRYLRQRLGCQWQQGGAVQRVGLDLAASPAGGRVHRRPGPHRRWPVGGRLQVIRVRRGRVVLVLLRRPVERFGMDHGAGRRGDRAERRGCRWIGGAGHRGDRRLAAQHHSGHPAGHPLAESAAAHRHRR